MSWLPETPAAQDQTGGVHPTAPICRKGCGASARRARAVLYASDLENNLNVCPKCGHHHRLSARARLDLLLDPEGRFEIGTEVCSHGQSEVQNSRRYPERLHAATEDTGETDSLVVMQGAIKTLPVVVACFEFDFMGGSMGSVLGERFVRGVRTALEQKMPFICVTASGGT